MYPKFREILCCSRFRLKLQCLQPFRIGLDKRSPSYILLLLLHHETILLGVLKTQTSTAMPKASSSATLLCSSSETVATGTQRVQTGNYSVCTSLPVDVIWPAEHLFLIMGRGGGGESVEKMKRQKFVQFSEPKQSFKRRSWRSPSSPSAVSTQPVYLIFLCRNYFMPELCSQILHNAACLKHYLLQS